MLNRSAAPLAHFEALFQQDPDPWRTKISRAEQVKRQAIVSMMGTHRFGRVLELGCGNGSNSAALARHALRLDACDGAISAIKAARRTLAGYRNAHVHHLRLPSRFPGHRFDAIIVAELLYYLDDRTLKLLMAEIDRTLRPGGGLFLCHHHLQFHDAAQRQAGLHQRFTAFSRFSWCNHRILRTGRWEAAHLRRNRAR